MTVIKDVASGIINKVLDRNAEIAEKRMEICKSCPLYKEGIRGPICNPNLWINKNGEVSNIKLNDEYKRGCNCFLILKTRNISNSCIINKW